jgi:hypothetical protein
MAVAGVLDLPLEVLTGVCLQLGLYNLIRVAETCKHFRHGDAGMETVELPTKSPVVTALGELAFPCRELIPSMRPIGCSDSWVAYLARCARQRCCREAPLIAAGSVQSLCVDATRRLQACGRGAAVGHDDETACLSVPTPVLVLAGVRVRSVAAENLHSLALGWDGRVYSWGRNTFGELGVGDQLTESAALVEGLEGVCSIAARKYHSLAVTQSGLVYSWGDVRLSDDMDYAFRPMIVEGFGGVRVRRVYAGQVESFAIGQDGELFSWGRGTYGLLGHGDREHQPSPNRVEALRGVRMSSVATGMFHALALAEDGLVYAWGKCVNDDLAGNPHVVGEMLPKPVEAIRGVRVGSVAAGGHRSYGWLTRASCGRGDSMMSISQRSAMASRFGVPCPSPLRRCGASNWMRWPPVLITRWRWRTTEGCTRGVTTSQQNGVRSAWALQ